MLRPAHFFCLAVAATLCLSACTGDQSQTSEKKAATTDDNNDNASADSTNNTASPSAASSSTASSSTASSSATADGLKTVFTQLQKAIRAKDTATAAALTKALFPDDESLKKVVKDKAIPKIKTMHAQFASAPADRLAGMFATDPARTEILIHAATTEEIAAYKSGGTAYNEFPGGAKTAAESVLQPGITFYELELVEPGQDTGTKYHLFYHDGQNWKMLGPIWRAL